MVREFLTTLFFVLTFCIYLTGQNNWIGDGGEITMWQDCNEVRVQTIEIPDYPENLVLCRYEWTGNGTGGVLKYCECLDTVTIEKFEIPNLDSVTIQKRVWWMFSGVTQYGLSNDTTAVNCDIQPPPPVNNTETLQWQTLYIETAMHGVVVIYDTTGLVKIIEFAPGTHIIDLSQFVGMYAAVIYQNGEQKIYYISNS